MTSNAVFYKQGLAKIKAPRNKQIKKEKKITQECIAYKTTLKQWRLSIKNIYTLKINHE